MARYFMGVSTGIGKKSGRPWYAVNILRFVEQWGNWAFTPCYCSEKFFNQVKQDTGKKFIVGGAVLLTPDIDGSLIGMEPDETAEPLDLVE